MQNVYINSQQLYYVHAYVFFVHPGAFMKCLHSVCQQVAKYREHRTTIVM